MGIIPYVFIKIESADCEGGALNDPEDIQLSDIMLCIGLFPQNMQITR